MRVGVVCEGQTDYHAIECFFTEALNSRGVKVEFRALQPLIDNCQPEAGWGNVLLWLRNKPPITRVKQYFSGGLFGGDLAVEPLDALLIHLDSDILSDESFRNYMRNTYACTVSEPAGSDDRAQQIREVISTVARFEDMTDADRQRHVRAVAVESTEAWCIAASNPSIKDTEILSGKTLVDEFMSALERSEGRPPSLAYARMNKAVKRRKKFCKAHQRHADRVIKACKQFSVSLNELASLA